MSEVSPPSGLQAFAAAAADKFSIRSGSNRTFLSRAVDHQAGIHLQNRSISWNCNAASTGRPTDVTVSLSCLFGTIDPTTAVSHSHRQKLIEHRNPERSRHSPLTTASSQASCYLFAVFVQVQRSGVLNLLV